MKPLRVLIVEDSEADAALVIRELEKAGYSPVSRRVSAVAEMQHALEKEAWDVVLCDYVIPGFGAMGALDLLKKRGLDLPCIIMSGHIGEDTAVQAMKSGAHDYIMKNNLQRLGPAIQRELDEAENRRARRKAEQELTRSEAELRSLSHRLIKVQEEERRAIARELHDKVGQSLTVLSLLLGQLKRNLPDPGNPTLKEASEIIREITGQIRALSQSLHPVMLDDMGLLPALPWYFQDVEKSKGIKIHFEHPQMENDLSPTMNVNIFRIIQEALTNSVKYAGVNQVSVSLTRRNTELVVQIEDKGTGFEPDKVPESSSGLRSIRERALSLRGTARIESSPGRGTTITVTLPLENSADQAYWSG